MPDALTWWTALKTKKELAQIYLAGARFNHPHRLGTLALSGTLSYEIDERLFTANATPANGQTCFTYTVAADFADATPWTRYFEPKCPFVHLLGALLGTREFALLHRPGWPWAIQHQYNGTTTPDIIGSVVRRLYTYSTGSASWSLTTTDPAEDLLFDHYYYIEGGGHPASGGNDGTSPTDIDLIPAWSGTYGYLLNDYTWDALTRFPWDATWSTETTAFSDGFTDFLAARNTADGAGHSGTSGLTLTFTNV